MTQTIFHTAYYVSGVINPTEAIGSFTLDVSKYSEKRRAKRLDRAIFGSYPPRQRPSRGYRRHIRKAKARIN